MHCRITISVCLVGFALLAACSKPSSISISETNSTPAAATPVEVPSSKSVEIAGTTSSQATTAAVQAFVDPATGELRAPTEAEQAVIQKARVQATAVMPNTITPPVKITTLPNGMTEYELGRQAEVQETVCVQPNGFLGACSPTQNAELHNLAKKKSP